MASVDVNHFEREVSCTYRGEQYLVRDNGAIFRRFREGKRRRPLDDTWTFGNPCTSSGYMMMSNHRVHQIIATGFHGPQPSKGHVIDHIDTNRRNNRPENLRWVTRLENILLNPITAKRVKYHYGSIENFLADPSRVRHGALAKDFDWMRTVTKAEAEYSLKRLSGWAESDSPSNGGTLGDWIFRPQRDTGAKDLAALDGPSSSGRPTSDGPRRRASLGDRVFKPEPNLWAAEPDALVESKTPGAVQRHWRIPAEFPLCPQPGQENPLEAYFNRLEEDAVFAVTRFGQTDVVQAALCFDQKELVVLGSQQEGAVKPWSLAKVTFEDSRFVHESCGTFFSLEGAEKQFAVSQGLPWEGGETLDDYC